MTESIMDELEDYLLRQESAYAKACKARLMANPDCRDPNHPGCPICEPSETKTTNERRGELTARLFAPVSSTAGLYLAADAK